MYIVIETHGGTEQVFICTDENGNTKVFQTRDEAQHEADECQDGIVVDLSKNLIKIVVVVKKGAVETILSNVSGKEFETEVIDLDAQDHEQEIAAKKALRYAQEIQKLNPIL